MASKITVLRLYVGITIVKVGFIWVVTFSGIISCSSEMSVFIIYENDLAS